MPRFSRRSRDRLDSCDERLQRVFDKVVETFDCSIIQGHRGEEEQNEAFRTGKSQLRFPESKHNKTPSLAVDVAPYPIDWNDHRRFYLFAGYAMATAQDMGIRLRWGGDWDGDFTWKDQTFHDLPHFEILGD